MQPDVIIDDTTNLTPDDPSPEAQWREIAAHLRDMADRAEAGQYGWLYIAARPVDADGATDEDLFAQGEGVGELTACLTATIENIGATLAEVS
jgi:hypothetical protein